MVELLFREVLRLPTVIIDISDYLETDYEGDDAKTIITRLLFKAEGNPLVVSTVVICLDEFDKLASNQNNARVDGQGTTKDVSGFGVQKELLRMLEEAHIDVPLDRRTLKTILTDNVIRKFTREFESEVLKLRVDSRVLDHIVEQSFERQTGARGLNSVLTQYIENAAFEQFGSGEEVEVRLRLRNGKIRVEKTKRRNKSSSR